ncbi:hypothetical protein [Methanoregula sp.]|uniref:hypothetical protein n=1 Tax=Methanoregula sp. TaxID=2052170 RepID=UPI003569E482
MTTDLEKPQWTYTILLDGIENPRQPTGGRTLTITGFELSYKSGVEESIRVTLQGTVPAVTKTSEKTIVKIGEYDSGNSLITSTMREQKATIINTAEVATAISARSNDLQTFRSHIDEKSALGIDTSAAESKYNDAKSKIDAARALTSSQYETAQSYITAAQTSITDGEKALNKAWAEYDVANAQTPINNVDVVIAWFKGNQSTANDAGLPTIITKREVAVSYISTANDEIASGNYDQARTKAQEAFDKGNESYTDALTLQKKLSSGWSFSFPKIDGLVFIIAGIIVVVLVVVGVIIYRKRSRWDELG